ncbi:phytanoyl-CoA dioxygenase family protein [Mycobacterium paraterrae]|uniref:Phytanoyl-CoA dioxygenase family protein n=1 Tax=Mycobacterium paraterrae TaxID=577492 RepID=A0ABY3VP70_9MYCO|nr:phytanoyl-CoA dioxygenase family protein [Mycobacterium paraterrae]UMB69921.1 phytanoyl-CoA dioxygenase family protein [Mycobacterium paraterrae]
MPKAVRSVGSATSSAELAEVLREDGCVVITGLAPAETMDRVLAEVEPYLLATGGGNTEFLGAATQRTGALIARSPTARSLITDPVIIDTLDLVLGDHASTFQIDLTQLVTIGAGEPAQMIHRDQWSFDRYQFPRGFEAEVAAMWAVTDFTEEMGATRMVVGSHRWEDDPDDVDPALSSPAVMTKGSVLLYTGSVFHGGGANTTDRCRIGMNIGYSLGWLRQEENQYLACPPEIARTLPEGLLRLMGYQRGAYSIGYVDNMREPLDWLYGSTAHISDYYGYRRAARKRLKETRRYVPPAKSSDGTTLLDPTPAHR